VIKLYKRRKPGKNLKKPLKHNPNLKGSYGQAKSIAVKKSIKQKRKPKSSRKIGLRSYSLSY